MPDGTVPCRPWRRQLPTPYQDAGQPSADPASRWRHADHDCQKSVQADMRASRCDMPLNDGELGLPAIGRVPGSMRVCSSCSGRHRGKQEGYLTPAASGAQAAFRTGPPSPAADAAGHLPREPARAAQRTAMVPKTPSPSIWPPVPVPAILAAAGDVGARYHRARLDDIQHMAPCLASPDAALSDVATGNVGHIPVLPHYAVQLRMFTDGAGRHGALPWSHRPDDAHAPRRRPLDWIRSVTHLRPVEHDGAVAPCEPTMTAHQVTIVTGSEFASRGRSWTWWLAYPFRTA